MWKAGCATAILGLIISMASFVFLGTAAKKATESRQVVNVPIFPTELVETDDILVDAGRWARVEVSLNFQLPEGRFEALGNSAVTLDSAIDLSYEVTDEMGNNVYHQAGSATGYVIVPRTDLSNDTPPEQVCEVTFRGEAFEAPASGIVRVQLNVQAPSIDEGILETGSLKVFDGIVPDASSWVLKGVLSFFLGPFVTFVGVVVFIVGLFLAYRKKNAKASDPPSVPGS